MSETQPQVGDWVVLYGSLMRRLGAMQGLGVGGQLRFVGPCVITGELFDLGDYPGMRHGDGRVIAELYALLDVDVIDALDEFEHYKASERRESLYLRERVALLEPPETRAWIYVYNDVPDASTRIVSGDWRAHVAERAGDRNP